MVCCSEDGQDLGADIVGYYWDCGSREKREPRLILIEFLVLGARKSQMDGKNFAIGECDVTGFFLFGFDGSMQSNSFIVMTAEGT